MSITDPPADAVQPEGQGGEGTGGDPPYADYLSRIPEEVRGEVEPVFKDWDANVTRRFQEASEYRQGWQPYEQIGVNQHSPEVVEWALQLGQLAQENPKAFQEWFQDYAQQRGLTPAQAAAEVQQNQDLDMFDTGQQFQEVLKERLTPLEQQLQEFAQWREQQEQTARTSEAQRFVEGQLAELEQKHGAEFNREAVELFVANFLESDPKHAVPRAYEAYQSMRNQIEKAALQAKADAPAPAEGGGVPDVTPEKITSFKEAEAVATELLRNNNRA